MRADDLEIAYLKEEIDFENWDKSRIGTAKIRSKSDLEKILVDKSVSDAIISVARRFGNLDRALRYTIKRRRNKKSYKILPDVEEGSELGQKIKEHFYEQLMSQGFDEDESSRVMTNMRIVGNPSGFAHGRQEEERETPEDKLEYQEIVRQLYDGYVITDTQIPLFRSSALPTMAYEQESAGTFFKYFIELCDRVDFRDLLGSRDKLRLILAGMDYVAMCTRGERVQDEKGGKVRTAPNILQEFVPVTSIHSDHFGRERGVFMFNGVLGKAGNVLNSPFKTYRDLQFPFLFKHEGAMKVAASLEESINEIFQWVMTGVMPEGSSFRWDGQRREGLLSPREYGLTPENFSPELDEFDVTQIDMHTSTEGKRQVSTRFDNLLGRYGFNSFCVNSPTFMPSGVVGRLLVNAPLDRIGFTDDNGFGTASGDPAATAHNTCEVSRLLIKGLSFISRKYNLLAKSKFRLSLDELNSGCVIRNKMLTDDNLLLTFHPRVTEAVRGAIIKFRNLEAEIQQGDSFLKYHYKIEKTGTGRDTRWTVHPSKHWPTYYIKAYADEGPLIESWDGQWYRGGNRQRSLPFGIARMSRWLSYSLGNPDLIRLVSEETAYLESVLKQDWQEIFRIDQNWFKRFLLESTDTGEKSNAISYLFKQDLKYFYMGNYRRDIPTEILNQYFFSVTKDQLMSITAGVVDHTLTNKYEEPEPPKSEKEIRRMRLAHGEYLESVIPVYEYILKLYEDLYGPDMQIRKRIQQLVSLT